MKQTTELLSGLIQSGIRKLFQEGETIVSEHSYIRSVPIIVDGRVKIIRSDADRELVLYYLQPGEGCVMSFMAALFNETQTVRMVADQDCIVSFVSIDDVQAAMRHRPELLMYMFQVYHKRFGELLDLVDAVAFRKMDDRLLQYLEKKAQLTQSNVLHLTHEQIALELGTAREVISRLLKQMESRGLVSLSRNNIELHK
jgi:CRP/FNR family transcriptional regulator, anaerobic regulatory protein